MHQRYGTAEPTDATAFNVIRSGRVINRRMGSNGPEVLITYYDRGVTSDWLPVGQQGSNGCTMFYCPRVGDNVTALHYPTSIEQGIIVCTNPTANGGAIQPDSINSVAMMGDNGEQFSYNPDTKTLSIQGVGTIKVSSAGDTDIQTNGNLNATVGGNLNAQVSGAANVSAPSITLDAPDVFITGTLHCDLFKGYQGTPLAQPHMTNADGAGAGA